MTAASFGENPARHSIISAAKPVEFLGSSDRDISNFPRQARKAAGYELLKVQEGLQPSDFKPITEIGKGVQELRIWIEDGTFRVIYLAKLPEAVYVLHAFEKKTRATSKADMDLARRRLKDLMQQRGRHDD